MIKTQNYFRLFLLLYFSFSTFNLSAQTCYDQLSDTIRSAITALQAHDTILMYQDNPHFVILDVRTAGEYNPSHIEQAINYDYYGSSFSTMINNLDRNKVYLVYCGSGSRSTLTYNMMIASHFRNVYNMSGGMGSWNSNSLPTVNFTAAQFTYFGDSIRTFNPTEIGLTDSTCLTITNSANSQLSITSITGCDGNIFRVEYDTQLLLNGSINYTFYFYYTPDDIEADSTVVNITTNAESQYIYLKGVPNNTSNISLSSINNDIQFQFIENGINISTSNNSVPTIQLYNLSGKVLKSQITNFVETDNLTSGLYILKVISENQSRSLKFIK